MKLCETCKHWRAPETPHDEIPGVGVCTAVVQFWDATEWEDGPPYGRKLLPEYATKLAFVQDGSDYRAELKTFPTFGCVQHES